MCTVTFIPTSGGALISSSRDEKIGRGKAHAPAFYDVHGTRLLFPKDPDASGSWIAIQQDGSVAVLLNGAWEKHSPVYPYRTSRGLILLEIAAAADICGQFATINLEGIEPFTVIIFQSEKLWECRWDGKQKYSKALPATIPYIWSSVTLYEKSVIAQREQWFSQWLNNHNDPRMADIRNFHLSAGNDDQHNGVRMNRNGKMLTVSLTFVELRPDKALVYYDDLGDNSSYSSVLPFYQESETNA